MRQKALTVCGHHGKKPERATALPLLLSIMIDGWKLFLNIKNNGSDFGILSSTVMPPEQQYSAPDLATVLV